MGSFLLWTGCRNSPTLMGAMQACRGRNGLFVAAYMLKRALAQCCRVPAKATAWGGMSYRWAADILLDLVQASAIASVVPYASSPHPCSLIDWNKGKSLCFILYSKFCAGLFSLPFFTHFQQNKRWKLFGDVNYQFNTALLMTYTQIYDEIRAALLIRNKPSIL